MGLRFLLVSVMVFPIRFGSTGCADFCRLCFRLLIGVCLLCWVLSAWYGNTLELHFFSWFAQNPYWVCFIMKLLEGSCLFCYPGCVSSHCFFLVCVWRGSLLSWFWFSCDFG
ncbi:hypothetical protein BRARA_I02970 [Brassica rapa]|uniref:Uncharacterized protein n=1 Tax=Brassica campestris TaxID=3711 RepID=A0A397Y0J8_BRACM|nr:hypothetical protein BRARA_I02970 [Brassica rapa]